MAGRKSSGQKMLALGNEDFIAGIESGFQIFDVITHAEQSFCGVLLRLKLRFGVIAIFFESGDFARL